MIREKEGLIIIPPTADNQRLGHWFGPVFFVRGVQCAVIFAL